MNKLAQLTIKETHEGLVSKDFSCVELTRAVLDEINNKEKEIEAFITLTPELALEQAKKVDELISQDQPIASLTGIPVAIKDVISTRGITTTAGSKILEDYIPPYNATVVAKLRNQHAIILGKTNCDEFAMGSSTENSAYQKTKNPHDPTRVPGGSSGGSAAAVAADMCIYALGSDTGGSIRQPASFCGVVGLKPTYGRVSRYGLFAMGSSLDCIGPMTKTVEDATLVLSVMAGKDGLDATTVDEPVPDYAQNIKEGIKGIKIGFPREYFAKGLDKGVEEKIKVAVKKLEELGGSIEEVDISHQQYALATYYLIMASEASTNLARYDGIRYGHDRDKFGPEPKRRIMLGAYALSAGYVDQYYNQAAKVRALLREDFRKAFKKIDVIVGPVSPTVAWKLGEKLDDPLKMYLSDIYTITANLVGIPAISIPCLPVEALAKSGGLVNDLPVGLQIMGNFFQEGTILKVAHAYEQAAK